MPARGFPAIIQGHISEEAASETSSLPPSLPGSIWENGRAIFLISKRLEGEMMSLGIGPSPLRCGEIEGGDSFPCLSLRVRDLNFSPISEGGGRGEVEGKGKKIMFRLYKIEIGF